MCSHRRASALNNSQARRNGGGGGGGGVLTRENFVCVAFLTMIELGDHGHGCCHELVFGDDEAHGRIVCEN